jgi:hypothetical protein
MFQYCQEEKSLILQAQLSSTNKRLGDAASLSANDENMFYNSPQAKRHAVC